MRQFVFAAVAVSVLVAGARTTLAGQITYSLQNYAADQNGSTLSGSVTTDGNLGTLTSADIVAWTWTVTPPVGPPLTLSGVTSTVSLLMATDQQLLLPIGENNAIPSEFFLVGPVGSSTAQLEYFRPSVGQGDSIYSAANGNLASAYWITDNPQMGGTDPWVIGVATSSVPEPSGVVLLGLGITGFIVAGARRRFSRKQCN
jgi:PEP-CTERM motif